MILDTRLPARRQFSQGLSGGQLELAAVWALEIDESFDTDRTIPDKDAVALGCCVCWDTRRPGGISHGSSGAVAHRLK